MPSIDLTEQLARAAAWDAGNAHARQHGRTGWNKDDYLVVCATFDRLIPHLPEEARFRLTGNADGIVNDE